MKQQRTEALKNLKEWVKPGDTLYTVVRSVARSGMSRHIDVMKFDGKRFIYLTSNMASAGIAGMRMSEREWSQSKGASIPGCAMDMGFHAVDSLCHALFGKGMYEAGVEQRWI